MLKLIRFVYIWNSLAYGSIIKPYRMNRNYFKIKSYSLKISKKLKLLEPVVLKREKRSCTWRYILSKDNFYLCVSFPSSKIVYKVCTNFLNDLPLSSNILK